MTISVTVICSKCAKAPPADGCDLPACSWRTQAIIDAINKGALVHTKCDMTNNSEQSIADGYLNINLTAYRKTIGTC